MGKYYHGPKLVEEADRLIKRLEGLFDDVTDKQLGVIRNRLTEAEFTGTSYAPLPDVSAVIRVISTVQKEYPDTAQAPEPKRAYKDQYGAMICRDGEKIVRDRRFFYNMLVLCDASLFGGEYPQQWINEAYELMDDEHKRLHDGADTQGKMNVLVEYYKGLDLPPRKHKTYDQCAQDREEAMRNGRNWTRTY